MLLEAIRSGLERYRSTPKIVVNWRTWAVRRTLSPFVALPCRLVSNAGSEFILGRDLVDDYVLDDVLGPLRDVYFPHELETLTAPLVLEIGAHAGIVAVELLRRTPKAQLIAVEPGPPVLRRLRRNLVVNDVVDRCEILQAAIAEHDGTAQLRASKDGSWGDSTEPRENDENYLPGGVRVRTMTLSAVLRGRQPDIVICNAEGAEFVLIPQLLALGLRPHVIVLMTHSRHGDASGIFDALRAAGFEASQVGQDPQHFHCRPRRLHYPAQVLGD